MRAVEAGESFIVTRNGVPTAQLVPLRRRTEVPRDEALLDTSVVIDLDVLAAGLLPAVLLVSAVTLAELSRGPHATEDPLERTVDLYIAAVALANGLPLYTRNPDDFHGVADLVDIVAV